MAKHNIHMMFVKPVRAVLYLLCCSGFITVCAEENNLELKMLVDVSGSMNKNDPQNLRQPAVRMVAGLLPENSKGGIWTFSAASNMLVPFRRVDENWRNVARAKSYQIKSPGLHTDIENALNVATTGWLEMDVKNSRQLILLTDGQVDVGNNGDESKASRQRIIENIIPQLQQAGVAVHTISLSDSTDERLMDRLSISTDGMFFKAETAEELKRIFTYLWQKTTHAEILPIDDNHFEIDSAINEVTLLLMHDKNDEVRLKLPGGEQWSRQSYSDKIRWYEDQGYSLVTIPKPQPGVWSLIGNYTDESHVVVISDLKVNVEFMPSNILAGETIRFMASIINEGKVISNRNIVDKIKISMKLIFSAQTVNEAFSAANSEGVFSLERVFEKPGKYEVIIRAESPTFRREYHDFIIVHDKVANVQVSGDDKGDMRVDVRLRGELLDKKSVAIDALLPGGERYILEQMENRWTGLIPGKYRGEELKLSMAGERHDGQKFIAGGQAKLISGNESDLGLVAEQAVNEDVNTVKESGSAELLKSGGDSKVTQVNWLYTAWITGAFLGVFVLVSVAGLLYFKRKN